MFEKFLLVNLESVFFKLLSLNIDFDVFDAYLKIINVVGKICIDLLKVQKYDMMQNA